MSKRFKPIIAAFGGLAALSSTPIAQAQEPRDEAPALTEQQRLRAQSPGGGLTPGVVLPSWPQGVNAGGSPVTDELLANPSPNDWLSWRRTRDGLGFSPLSSIDKVTVISTDGASQLTKSVAGNVTQGMQFASDLLGVDLGALFQRLASGRDNGAVASSNGPAAVAPTSPPDAG